MKTLLLFIFIVWGLTGWCQSQDSVLIRDNWYKRDTTRLKQSLKDSLNPGNEMRIMPTHSKNTEQGIRILSGESDFIPFSGKTDPEIQVAGRRYKKSRNRRDYAYFRGHLCGANFGFVNFAHTDYSMYAPEADGFMDLDYANSFVMQFNVCEQSINFSPRNIFGMVLGLGLEYQRLRFDQKHVSITVGENNHVEPRILDPDWSIKKNSFKILYLSVPVLFELQMPARRRQRFYIAAGAMGGIRLLSRTKIIYYNPEGEKKRNRTTDDYSLMPIKADLIARIGYHSWNIWASYTVTEMFRSKKGPEVHPCSLGLGFTFH